MKLTKKAFKALIREELKNAKGVIQKIIKEGEIFRNRNRLLPSEWEEFKQKFLKDNKDHKVVSGKGIEAIVKKSEPRKAVVKYIKDDFQAHHDLKSSEFFKYIR